MSSPVLASRFAISLNIYRSDQGSNGRTVEPSHIGSSRGPDSPYSIWDKEVRGRIQEGEGALRVCKDSRNMNGLVE